MRILVTGADGFVGNTLCPYLETKGHSVRRAVWKIKDRFSPEHNWIETGNIGTKENWSETVRDVHAIVHLAGRAHILHETAVDPLAQFRQVNVEATRRLAQAAAETGVKRFIFVSSIGVTGDHTLPGQVVTEETPPAPRKDYAISKWEAEQALQEIASQSTLEVVIIRPPLVYGPGVKGNFLRLLKLIDRRVPLPLGSIQNQRSLISVTNLADFITLCTIHPDAANETFVIADGQGVSIPTLIRRIAYHLEITVMLIPVPKTVLLGVARVFRVKHSLDQLVNSLVVDATKAKKLLGWTPVTTMDEELAKTTQWFRMKS